MRQVLAMKESGDGRAAKARALAIEDLRSLREEHSARFFSFEQEAWMTVIEAESKVTAEPTDLIGKMKKVQEDLAVRSGVVPPHWDKWNKCKRCGVVPGEIEVSGLLPECPWCSNSRANELLKPLRSAAFNAGELTK